MFVNVSEPQGNEELLRNSKAIRKYKRKKLQINFCIKSFLQISRGFSGPEFFFGIDIQKYFLTRILQNSPYSQNYGNFSVLATTPVRTNIYNIKRFKAPNMNNSFFFSVIFNIILAE